ncbi:MAG: GHKL domain-containing protein [Candidatus Thorarchaeota archaeon]|nr:GHKL domain-containing protein [Candidatus Thorarchaeota archaeon]
MEEYHSNPASEHNLRTSYQRFALFLLVLSAITLTRFHGYLLFHSLVEIFTVAIAWVVFTIAWKSREMVNSSYFLVIGVAFLHTGFIDLVHTLAYKGMGVFPAFDANLPTELWIAARLLESISLVAAILLKDKTINSMSIFAVYFGVTGILLWSIFSGPFPDCYVQGTGLTLFKIFSEYIIIILLAVAIYLYHRNRSDFDSDFRITLMGALLFTIAAELAFTIYVDVYDISNMLGHIFKFISFYLFYQAVIRGSFMNPFGTLFRNLQQSELEAKRKASALKRMNEELEAFVAMVSHDLRSPLQVLNLAIEELRAECEDADENPQQLSTIKKTTDNLSNLLSDLSRLSQVASSEFQRSSFNLSKLIREEAELLQKQWDSVSFNVEIEDNLMVNGDKGLVRILIQNLLSNAFKYSQDIENPVIRAGKSQQKNRDIYYVEDNGIGFDMDNMDDVFAPFKTAHDKEYTGSGIGLSIVQKVVEAHSGKIWAESKPSEGATFYFMLEPESVS